jgi:hypothetical protein
MYVARKPVAPEVQTASSRRMKYVNRFQHQLTLQRLNFFWVIYTNWVRIPQETHYVSATTPNMLMLFRETVAVYCENHIKVKVILRLTVSQSVSLGVEPHLGPMTRFITVWQLRSSFCGAPSLTRGRVCLLYMLMALDSAIFFGSQSRGTRDHILLSQIWDFSFRRLLRLAVTVEVFNPASTRVWEPYFFFLWRYSPHLGLGLPPWNFPFHFSLLDLGHSVD